MSEAGKTIAVKAPMQAVVHSVNVAVGDAVQAGQEVAVLEAMKMQHGLVTPTAGQVTAVKFAVGEVVEEGQLVVSVAAGAAVEAAEAETSKADDPDHIRADLAELQARLARTEDANRKEKIDERHSQGYRTARENIADICDADSYI